MNYNNYGTLNVRTSVASGALPVPKTVIRIFGADEDNGYVEYSILTDDDGSTARITLPAPAKVYSTEPFSPEVPYALYDIEASREGYYTKRIHNVAIFPDTNTSQIINMIPISISEGGAFYPKGNLEATVKENEFLEA